MSPLSTKPRWRVHLAPHRVSLVRLKGGWRLGVQAKSVLPSSGAHWRDALTAVRDGLAGSLGKGTLEVVLASHYCRFVLVPWDAGLVDEAARLTLARLLFERQYAPERAGDYHFLCSPPRFGQPQVAVAVETALVEALSQLADDTGLVLASVMPSLAVVWNGFHTQLDSGTLVLVEQDRQVWLTHENKAIQQIQVRPHTPHALMSATGLTVFAPGLSDLDPVQTLSPRAGPGFEPDRDVDHHFTLCGVF